YQYGAPPNVPPGFGQLPYNPYAPQALNDAINKSRRTVLVIVAVSVGLGMLGVVMAVVFLFLF
ncbi:MAG: hypothetical protein ABI193_10025, partial [Minicystis sp.]